MDNKKTKHPDDIKMEDLDNWVPSDGLQMAGTESVNLDNGMMTYSYGDLGQLDLFSEEDMREKYPALKQAYEHYQSILEVCKTKEKEENED